jgi:predicted dinucleotide-binding enzyme
MKMKHLNKSIRRTKYRYLQSKQVGEMVVVSTTVPKRFSRFLHTESKLRNQSVSSLVAELISERYKHIKTR